MKSLTAGMFALSLALIVGCNDRGTTGGPGVKNPDAPVAPVAKGTFTIDAPTTSVDVTVGATKSFEIGVDRGDEFNQAVTLTFESLPAGLTIRPESAVIAAGVEEVQLLVVAAPEAVPGEYIVKVHGKPATGAEAHSQFTVEIQAP